MYIRYGSMQQCFFSWEKKKKNLTFVCFSLAEVFEKSQKRRSVRSKHGRWNGASSGEHFNSSLKRATPTVILDKVFEADVCYKFIIVLFLHSLPFYFVVEESTKCNNKTNNTPAFIQPLTAVYDQKKKKRLKKTKNKKSQRFVWVVHH